MRESLGRFRLSFTTDNRSLFADGLSSGGDVTANWVELTPLSANSLNGSAMTIQGDNSILVSTASTPTTDTYTIVAETTATGITGFRLEAISDSSLPTQGPGRADDGNFVLSELTIDAMAVPEPSAVLLLALGGWLLRRRLSGSRS